MSKNVKIDNRTMYQVYSYEAKLFFTGLDGLSKCIMASFSKETVANICA